MLSVSGELPVGMWSWYLKTVHFHVRLFHLLANVGGCSGDTQLFYVLCVLLITPAPSKGEERVS